MLSSEGLSRIHASRLEEEVSSLIEASRITEQRIFDPSDVLRHPEVILFFKETVIPRCPQAQYNGEINSLLFVRCLLQKHQRLVSESLHCEEDVVKLTTHLFGLVKCSHSKRLDYLKVDDLTCSKGLLGILQEAYKRLASCQSVQNTSSGQLQKMKEQLVNFAEQLLKSAEERISSSFQREFNRLGKKQEDLKFINRKLQEYVGRLRLVEAQNRTLKAQNKRLGEQTKERCRTPQLSLRINK